ncbi:YCF48-related protein [Pseudomonas silvicola]|nr:YCF48-related protein [Pseudomonas silvicola]
MNRCSAALFCVAQLAWFAASAAPPTFIDPLDQPSAVLRASRQGELMDVVDTGKRLVAVGPGGYIVVSDDQGNTWVQKPSPVSSDLTAVAFATAEQGWAIGHDGVVLHTADGGSTWVKQMDGRLLATQLQPYYQKRAAEGDAKASRFLPEAAQLASDPAAFPLFDVWFKNDQEGFVVGAFNLILHTVDGGKTWQPWMERTNNPQRYHLYSITGGRAGVFIAGELGLLLRLDSQGLSFDALESPYQGSFFGVMTRNDQVVAFGLRGNAFESSDGGQHWLRLQNGTDVTLAAGALLADGAVMLLDQDGQLLTAAPGQSRLVAETTSTRLPATALVVSVSKKQITLVGPFGARIAPLNKS